MPPDFWGLPAPAGSRAVDQRSTFRRSPSVRVDYSLRSKRADRRAPIGDSRPRKHCCADPHRAGCAAFARGGPGRTCGQLCAERTDQICNRTCSKSSDRKPCAGRCRNRRVSGWFRRALRQDRAGRIKVDGMGETLEAIALGVEGLRRDRIAGRFHEASYDCPADG